MKKFGIWFASAIALLAFAACNDDEEEDVKGETEYDDSYYAAQATVSSSDAGFTTNDNGGIIHFKTEGGTVTLNVSCGCEWLAECTATDLFGVSATSTSLTVTAYQNTVEKDLEGTITLKTENRRITFATITVTQTAYDAPEITVETTDWNVPAKGALTTEIAVEASADWTAEATDSWLTATKTDTGVSLTATENENTVERSSKVTLTCSDGVGSGYEYIVVTQDGAAYITLSSETLRLGVSGGASMVSVQSNFDWDFSYDSSNGWFTVTRNGDDLEVTCLTKNDGEEEREGTVTLTAGDGAENVTEEVLKVVQMTISEDDMILTYTIATANTSTGLPLYGTVNCIVDWGDGTVETVTSIQPSHTYAFAGEYDVTISGTVTALYTRGISSSSAPLSELTAVRQWGATGLTSMQYAFYHCTKLASLPETTGDGLAAVTTFYYAFYNCASLAELPSDLFAKCSKATDFTYAFWGCAMKNVPEELFAGCTAATVLQGVLDTCTSLEEIPKGLFANCTNVTNFKSVFYDCSSLKEIPSGLFDNCSKVTDFSGSFHGCSSLKTIPAGLFDNCPNVTSFYCTFVYCSSLEEIPAGLFDKCTRVTTFEGIFDTTAITSIPEGLFDNCTSVSTFYSAFYSCSLLEEIPAGLFDKCTRVTDFAYVFSFCPSLKAIPAGLFDKCTRVKTFKAAFQNCKSVTEMPEGLFDSCPNVTDFSYAVNGCAATTIPKGLFDKNLNVTNFEYTLASWSSVTDESPYTEIEVDGETVKVHLYERSKYASQLGCVAPTDYLGCFSFSSFSDMDSIPSNWGGNGASTSSISENGVPFVETSFVIKPEEF